MELTNEQLIALGGSRSVGVNGALAQLHGVTKKVGESDGRPLIETVPYDFAVNVRMNVMLIIQKLAPLMEAFEKARAELIKSYQKKAKDLKVELDDKFAGWDDFQKEHTELMQHKLEVDKLPKIKIEDLKIDTNKLPPTTLFALLPVLVVPE